MASTYSTDLRLELIGTGEQQGTWGVTTNKNLGTLIEAAIAGGITQDITGLATYTLTSLDGLPDQARSSIINFIGTLTGNCNIVAPSVSKQYVVKNSTTGGFSVFIKTAAGVSVGIPAGGTGAVVCNGTDFFGVQASAWFTARALAGNLVDGTVDVPFANNFIAQGTADSGLSGAQFLGALATGILKSTTTTGVLTIAVAGDFPTLNQDTTGTAAKADALNSATTVVNVSSSVAPTNGQVLTATGGSTATWQTPTGGGVTTFNGSTTGLTPATATSGAITLGGTLVVANGGTGVTASTGTVAVVLSTSPTLVTPLLGTPTSGVMSNCTVDGTNSVGFRNVPFNSQSAAYTTVLADSGKVIFHPSTDATIRTFTIDSNANVPYVIGTAITFINMTTQVVTIAITSDTMYLSGAGTTGSRSLALYGSATAIKMTSTTWLISGTNLT